jgi:predicted nucleic acid-binding protein
VTVFIDTSAFYAIIDRDDLNHARSGKLWDQLLRDAYALVTNNYVVVETSALVQHRLGVPAVRTFIEDMLPVVRIEWITEEYHRAAGNVLLAAGRRRLSLVDCVSFETMRRTGIRSAFCFDDRFREQGFQVLSNRP